MKRKIINREKIRHAFAKTSKKQKEAALIDATAFINAEFKFRGEPKTKTQKLAWPRKNAFFDDGSPITGVPEAVKQATAHLAGFMLADVPMNKFTLAEIIVILGPVLERDRLH